jgi:hypothetical protein
MALTPPPLAPQRNDRSTFSARLDAFITWLINFVTELVSLVANLNSIAAGGAYAIPYVGWGNGDPATVAGANGRLVIPGAQNAVASIWFNIFDARGKNMKSMFDDVFSSTSATKGYVTLFAQGDPSRWISYRVTSWAYDSATTRGVLGVSCTGYSDPNPLQAGEGQVMQITRTGDKGDTISDTPTMIVREQQAAGVGSATSLVAGTWVKRLLNSTAVNTIPLATLSNGVLSLPAGNYEMRADAVGIQCGAHKIRLINTIDGISEYGTPELAPTGTAVSNRSFVTWRFSINAAKTFELQHRVTSSAVGGAAASFDSTPELYAQVKIKKVS